MAERQFLFVGGPLNGQYIAVENGVVAYHATARAVSASEIHSFLFDSDSLVTGTVITYYKVSVADSNGQNRASMFMAGSYTPFTGTQGLYRLAFDEWVARNAENR